MTCFDPTKSMTGLSDEYSDIFEGTWQTICNGNFHLKHSKVRQVGLWGQNISLIDELGAIYVSKTD